MPTNAKQLVTDAKTRMRHSVDTVLRELQTMRTGRASVSMLDTIRVDYYGTPTPLNQVGNQAVPDPTLITLQPWDPSLVPAIEKAMTLLGYRPTVSLESGVSQAIAWYRENYDAVAGKK